MKNYKGENLTGDYIALSELRRKQQIDNAYVKRHQMDFEQTGRIDFAFEWGLTPERHDFWVDVYMGKEPSIPQSSLDELYSKGETLEIQDNKLFTAAVAAMQVLINKTSYSNEGLAFEAWDYAEALIAEGKKRNHL